MIRLAYELNIIDLPGVASSASAAQEKIILAAVDDFVKKRISFGCNSHIQVAF